MVSQDIGAAYRTRWEQFTRLAHTEDSLARERQGLRRRLLMPYIAFLIPVEDPAVSAQLAGWQRVFQHWMEYDPQPANRLHITLHYVGMLRSNPWVLLPMTWRRTVLSQLVDRVRVVVESFPQFEVQIGPLNSFPNVLFAEVQDPQRCLRLLRSSLRRALPLRARPPTLWSYLPHVTLGYWGEQPAAPLIEAMRSYRDADPVPLRVQSTKLTVYTRHDVPLDRALLETAEEDVIARFDLKAPDESGNSDHHTP
ncbi:MAG: 2'-5' RNA ligase family protein [Anaerolineae bacterium]|jgi:2'-5' RNA ligase|nr:2'-5' RNA ligase family protein [Anaerolineae bacterium]